MPSGVLRLAGVLPVRRSSSNCSSEGFFRANSAGPESGNQPMQCRSRVCRGLRKTTPRFAEQARDAEILSEEGETHQYIAHHLKSVRQHTG